MVVRDIAATIFAGKRVRADKTAAKSMLAGQHARDLCGNRSCAKRRRQHQRMRTAGKPAPRLRVLIRAHGVLVAPLRRGAEEIKKKKITPRCTHQYSPALK